MATEVNSNPGLQQIIHDSPESRKGRPCTVPPKGLVALNPDRSFQAAVSSASFNSFLACPGILTGVPRQRVRG